MKKIYFSGNRDKDKFCLVDDDDYKKLSRYKWYLKAEKYVRRNGWENGKYGEIKIHNNILGRLEKGLVIDHINGNGLDNRKENLRVATYSQNGGNCRTSKRNKSGFKGVWARNNPYKTKIDTMWKASIQLNRKAIRLGCFETKEEAALAYNNKALELFGEFAKLNVII